ncbi:hypothetical protein K491DRAFT_595945 [Lophiostoma macrostomum CBS 122681]|uniref:Uncharacterized protein n=1 Tax=Lophiostoma macrostomum CBS 122681 TaxID=1314788 RepID=A0A6A6TAT4_9PLEO|nr:hypothetical protein K491DRAFT_595945 [Lophiostoma macrostomum CBS 122681]
MEIRKGPSPRSRKTAEATIATDATETHPAFESDAFAVHMPTTREPILEPPVFRAKLPSPSRAQVEAYHTYKEKAEQVREKQQQEGVRVPSKIVSYDYTCAQAPPQPRVDPESRAGSPPNTEPAGSFPASPPVPQHGWARPAHHIQGPRSMSESMPLRIGRKPISLTGARPNDSKTRSFSRYDVSAGATHSTMSPSPSPKPHTVKIRLKPKSQDVPHVQREKDSWWSFTNHSPQNSANSSRSSSPTKNPFLSTTSTAANTLFGYGTHNANGTTAGASKTPRTPQKPVKVAPKSPSRWAWLRPSGPRIAKPTATLNVSPASTKPSVIKATPYIDPFVLHASPVPTQPTTPTCSRPASPKKLVRPQHASSSENRKFESGFLQVKSLASLLLKLCLVVYVLVGLYFLLDAVREAVHVLGAPFRAIKLLLGYIWFGGAFVAKFVARSWEKWGFKVALKGGWKGKWW